MLSTIVLGSIIVAAHAVVVMQAGMSLPSCWLFYLHVGSMFTVACCIAYWRERFHRTAFAASIDTDRRASRRRSPARVTEAGWTGPMSWAGQPAGN
jgi:hypothetical protein